MKTIENVSKSLENASFQALLGHFEPCPDSARLSRLGLADGACDLLFVPRPMLSVELQIVHNDELKGHRQLRVPSSMRLGELSYALIRSLRQSPLEDLAPSDIARP